MKSSNKPPTLEEFRAQAALTGLPLTPERPLAQVIALVDTLGDLISAGARKS